MPTRRRPIEIQQDQPLLDWLKLFVACFLLGGVGWMIIAPMVRALGQ